MELTARLNGPPRLTGKALIVLCSYRGGARREQPWRINSSVAGKIVNRLTLFGMRQFIATYRDHYANPRDFAYQTMLAHALIARARFDSFDVLIDASLDASDNQATFPGVDKVIVAPVQAPESLQSGRYDTIVLVYPDALGLSWSRVEARALAAAGTVVIVNGRRRLFTLDRNVRPKLLWRRFLANTRIVETLLGIAVIPVSAILAATDSLRQRT